MRIRGEQVQGSVEVDGTETNGGPGRLLCYFLFANHAV